MTQNCLLLNSDKTEVVAFGPEHFREKLSSYIPTLDGISLASGSTVREFWAIFDQNLSFDTHIKQVSRTAFFHLRNIAKVRNTLCQLPVYVQEADNLSTFKIRLKNVLFDKAYS